jgi:hypothetical protein
MKNITLAIVLLVTGASAMLAYLSVTGQLNKHAQKSSEHVYKVQVIDTPQSNGTVAHDYARVDMTDGTMCSLHGKFWLNGEFVNPCDGHKPYSLLDDAMKQTEQEQQK